MPLSSPPAGVLRDIGNKNNVNNVGSADARHKLGAVKLFHDENTDAANSSTGRRGSSKLSVKTPGLNTSNEAMVRRMEAAEAEAARYREELRQALATVKQRNQRVQELKASHAQSNERYTVLLKSNDEASKELAVLRTQLASNGGVGGASAAATVANVERLKAEAERMESSNELLREERAALNRRLTKRDAACAGMKDELSAAVKREDDLREQLETLQLDLEKASAEAHENAEALAEAREQVSQEDGDGGTAWPLQKAALEAQVQDLEEQLAAAGRRNASLVAERVVMGEETTRQSREHEVLVTSLQEELSTLHRRTSADLRDWQRRHREAVAAQRAVEGQLERLVEAGKSIALVGERQASLQQSLHETRDLLCAAMKSKITSAEAEAERGSAAAPPERVVEGILEHVLGRVFAIDDVRGNEGCLDGEEVRRRETEHELRRAALADLGDTLKRVTVEMVRCGSQHDLKDTVMCCR